MKKLIISCDDLGVSKETNLGIKNCRTFRDFGNTTGQEDGIRLTGVDGAEKQPRLGYVEILERHSPSSRPVILLLCFST